MEHPLVGLTAVVALGIGAQWLAWRLKLPSILLLLVVGFAAGTFHLLDPDALLGELLFPIVSLSVAIILFEGGLSLDIKELGEIGRVVRNLVTVGSLATWALSAAFAYVLLDFGAGLAVLFGAILIVTGPTVIGPMLRHIRPDARVGSAIKWEGIVNDPIGAILAVLVFEALLAGGGDSGIARAAWGVVSAAGVGGGFGLLGAGFLIVVLKRYWIPDFLHSPAALAVVVTVFTASNLVQTETGLLTVTVMGATLASQRFVTVRHIIEFKENLRVLLISALFILLAARVDLAAFRQTTLSSVLFLLALLVLVRPISVALATLRTRLNWRERVFLGFMAPRGIVAAAVSSIFALELSDAGYPGAERLIPITFLVIVATVGVYGLTAAGAARRLRVASPNPQGVLIVGAAPWVRALAQLLRELKFTVHLVDSNWANVTAARRTGLPASYQDILDDQVRANLNLDGIGTLLAVTPNDEVNALATLQFGEIFGRARVFQLAAGGSQARAGAGIPTHLRGRVLFGTGVTHSHISHRLETGAEIKRTPLTETFDYRAFRKLYGETATPLFAIRESGELVVYTAEVSPAPKPGQTLISLVGPGRPTELAADGDE